MELETNPRNKTILKWLKSHPLINRAALCVMVGYDKSNLKKAEDGQREIPDKYLEAFERELKKYGYKKKL